MSRKRSMPQESEPPSPPCGEPDSIININRLPTEAVGMPVEPRLNLPPRPKTVVSPNSRFVVELEPSNDIPLAPPGGGFVNTTNSLSLADSSPNLPIAYVPQRPPFNRASSVPKINVPLMRMINPITNQAELHIPQKSIYRTPILKSIRSLSPRPSILVEPDLTLVEHSDLEPLIPPGGCFI
ncbi:hypothetical protein BHYA_0047g00400 [Botrytis hyacinthi]|uniref:Uncharacterized protein n=1 Tax=Botrytis hyacinthi TaxID=278943 RepID=A0A4Z1GSF6_9HELO|nr:hypothetical protein BHYA_0047g00400 [Botrytis hyacinthi]